jgi:hypothetical protein
MAFVTIDVDVKMAVSVPRTPQVVAWMQDAMKTATAAVTRRAQQNLSGRFLRVRTGAGLGSLRTRIRTTREAVTGTVGTPNFYLRILHQGFPAQTLTTEKKGFTFFKGGHLVRAKSIRHPGVSARPWMQVAAQESQPEIVAAFDQVAGNIARFIAGSGGAGVPMSTPGASRAA